MKKLFLFTLFVSLLFCSCGNLINSKNQNVSENQGTVVLKLGSDAPDVGELSRTVGPQDGKPYTEVSEWTVTFTRGDFKQVETLSESSNSFALPVGSGYKVAVEGCVESDSSQVYYGESTFDITNSQTTSVTVLIGRKKTADGRGVLSYSITLGANIPLPEDESLQATFFNVTIIDLADGKEYSSLSSNVDRDLSNLNVAADFSDGNLNIYSMESSVPESDGIKSGYYKLIVSYSVEDTTYYLNIPDPYLEICDGCTTFAEVTVNGVSSTRTYYATAKPSSFNGLTKEFPVNINTLLTTLNSESGKEGWNTVDIYFDASEDVSSVMDLELPSGKSVNCYSGNIKFIDNSAYVTSFYVSATGTYKDSSDVNHDAAKTIYDVAQLINNVDYSDKDVTVRVSGVVYETKDSEFTKVKKLSLSNATLDYSNADIDAKGLKFNSTVSNSSVTLYGVNITYAGFSVESDNVSVTVTDSSIAVMDFAAGSLTIGGDSSGQIKIASGKTLTINPASFNEQDHKVTLCPDYTYHAYQTTDSLINTTPGYGISERVLAKLQLDNTNWSLTLQGKILEAGVLYLTSENYTTITSDDLTEGQIIRVLDNNIPAKEGTSEYVASEVHSLTTLFRFGINNNTKNITVDLSGYTNDISSVWFYNAAAKIILPDNTTSLHSQAFEITKNLRELQISSSNENYCAVDGILYSKDMTTLVRYPCAKEGDSFTLPNTVETLVDSAFKYTTDLKQIPNFKQVKNISNYCFQYSSIESLVLNDSISSIPMYSFDESKLITITLPSNLNSMGYNVFRKCSELTTIIFRSSLPPTIKDGNSVHEFYNCDSVETIYVPDGAVAAYRDSSTTGTTAAWFTYNYFSAEQLENMVKVDPSSPITSDFTITSVADLQRVSNQSNDLNNPNTFEGLTLTLAADLDLSSLTVEEWVPISTSFIRFELSDIQDNSDIENWDSITGDEDKRYAIRRNRCFKGTFDGNGHKITVAKRNSDDEDRAGLIAYNNGTVKNLIVECNSEVTDTAKNCKIYGFITMENLESGIIRNCKTSGSLYMRTNMYFSTMTCVNYGLVENCVNEANLTIEHPDEWGGYYAAIGGIVHCVQTGGIVRNCINYGSIYAKNVYIYCNEMYGLTDLNGRGGAITTIARDNSTIENCYWLKNCVKYYYNDSDYFEGENTSSETSPYIKDWIGNLKRSVTGKSYSYDSESGEEISTNVNYEGASEVTGTVTGCGSFDASNIITPGSESNCGSVQTLEYGTDLETSLNQYVSSNSSSGLKSWKTVDGKVLLDFTN